MPKKKLFCDLVINDINTDYLLYLFSILSHLDRGTLRLLMDNQRITDFKPEFRDDLCRLYNQAPSKVMYSHATHTSKQYLDLAILTLKQ